MIGVFGLNAVVGVLYIPWTAMMLDRASAWALAKLPRRRRSFRAETAKSLASGARGRDEGDSIVLQRESLAARCVREPIHHSRT